MVSGGKSPVQACAREASGPGAVGREMDVGWLASKEEGVWPPLTEDADDGAASPAPGVASSIRWPTSTEPTPSTMEWCVLCASAQRPLASPSTSAISHSGRWRSRRWEKKPDDHSASSS